MDFRLKMGLLGVYLKLCMISYKNSHPMWPKVTCDPFCPMGWFVLPHGWGKRDHFIFFLLINISRKSWYIWIFRLFPYILYITKYHSAKLHSCTCTGAAVIPFWKLSDPSCPTLLYILWVSLILTVVSEPQDIYINVQKN